MRAAIHLYYVSIYTRAAFRTAIRTDICCSGVVQIDGHCRPKILTVPRRAMAAPQDTAGQRDSEAPQHRRVVDCTAGDKKKKTPLFFECCCSPRLSRACLGKIILVLNNAHGKSIHCRLRFFFPFPQVVVQSARVALQVRKRRFLEPFYTKISTIQPRQARDKHGGAAALKPEWRCLAAARLAGRRRQAPRCGKRPFWSHVIPAVEKISLYQDRLGTNASGKAQKSGRRSADRTLNDFGAGGVDVLGNTVRETPFWTRF